MIPSFILSLVGCGKIRALPEWRNWQTRTTQNRVGFAHVGSIPTFGIIPFTGL